MQTLKEKIVKLRESQQNIHISAKKTLRKLLKDQFAQAYREKLIKFWSGVVKRNKVETYSQEGEDIIVRKLFQYCDSGFFVEVGAHHPTRYSNTYYLYKQGWRGIIIEPMPEMIQQFNKIRPRDINLGIGISDSEGEMTYYIFHEKALNTFSKELADERKKFCTFDYEVKVKLCRLDSILNNYRDQIPKIDLLSIDAEGFDLQVLKSNNWDKYVPKVIMVEVIGVGIEEISTTRISKFLSGKGYKLVAKTLSTCIFIHNQFDCPYNKEFMLIYEQ